MHEYLTNYRQFKPVFLEVTHPLNMDASTVFHRLSHIFESYLYNIAQPLIEPEIHTFSQTCTLMPE